MRRTGRLAAGGVRRLLEGHPQRARGHFPRRHRLGDVLRVARRPSGRDRRWPPQGRAPAGELLSFADALGRRPALGDPRLCPARADGRHQRRPADAGVARHRVPQRGGLEEGGAAGAHVHPAGRASLQLNAVDRDTLIDAQHPEKHRQLIVRVWAGWPLRAAGQDVSGSDHRPHVVQHLGFRRGRKGCVLCEWRFAHGIRL
ncbi:MAG: glycine radical domain-containing protein [Christensenellales bacterium]